MMVGTANVLQKIEFQSHTIVIDVGCIEYILGHSIIVDVRE